MSSKRIKYWLLAGVILANAISVYAQVTVEQKLFVISNSMMNGGEFVIEYTVKGTNLSNAKTLGSLNTDLLYDTTALKFSGESNWNELISEGTGYERYVSNNQEAGVNHSVRIMIQGLRVNSNDENSLSGYNIGSSYSSVVRINFTILDISKSATISFKSSTNQIGLFENPGNNPNTFVINDQILSVPAGIEDQPLPVTLSGFNSQVSLNNVTLIWTTSSETNNAGFSIERKSAEVSTWMKVGYVKGQGNSSTQIKYSFDDKNVSTGKFNYRLKQTDINGNYKYYNLNSTVEVGSPSKFNLSQNYPNPFNPVTKINYELAKDSKVNIKVYDLLGREVMNLVNQEQKAGYYTISLDAKTLASGTYFYRLTARSGNNDHIITKKMSLIK